MVAAGGLWVRVLSACGRSRGTCKLEWVLHETGEEG